MSAVGLSRETGRKVEGLEHLRQSIADILTTPVGTRVMRRDYGSRLFEFIDANLNPFTLVQIYAAIAEALRRWEPRLKLTRITAEAAPEEIASGRIRLDLVGEYLPEGREIRLEGLLV